MVVAADPTSQRIAARNRRDELVIYDQGGGELKHLNLGTTIRFAALLNHGAQIVVLTADQKVRHFNIDAAGPVAVAVAASK